MRLAVLVARAAQLDQRREQLMRQFLWYFDLLSESFSDLLLNLSIGRCLPVPRRVWLSALVRTAVKGHGRHPDATPHHPGNRRKPKEFPRKLTFSTGGACKHDNRRPT
jgi:hypothetical protein